MWLLYILSFEVWVYWKFFIRFVEDVCNAETNFSPICSSLIYSIVLFNYHVTSSPYVKLPVPTFPYNSLLILSYIYPTPSFLTGIRSYTRLSPTFI